MPPTTVALALEHPVVRASLAAVLEHEAGVEVVGMTVTPGGTLELAAALQPDVVVLASRFDGRSALPVLARLRHVAPRTRIVMVDVAGSQAFAEHARALGAERVLLTEHAAEQLVDALRMPAAA